MWIEGIKMSEEPEREEALSLLGELRLNSGLDIVFRKRNEEEWRATISLPALPSLGDRALVLTKVEGEDDYSREITAVYEGGVVLTLSQDLLSEADIFSALQPLISEVELLFSEFIEITPRGLGGDSYRVLPTVGKDYSSWRAHDRETGVDVEVSLRGPLLNERGGAYHYHLIAEVSVGDSLLGTYETLLSPGESILEALKWSILQSRVERSLREIGNIVARYLGK